MIKTSKCLKCGAVTLFQQIQDEEVTRTIAHCTIPAKIFSKVFSLREFDFQHDSCNSCDNFYSIDYCGCGSGKKVGKCNAGTQWCHSGYPGKDVYMPIVSELAQQILEAQLQPKVKTV